MRPLVRGDVERCLPCRFADVLDDDVGAVAARRLLHRGLHVVGCVVERDVGAELSRARELLVARGRDDDARAERLRDRERSGRDAAADAPREDPLALLQVRARDEHPVRGLEDERERRRLLEAQVAGDGVDVRLGNRDQLGVRPVTVLADHVDRAGRRLDAGIDHDALAGVDADARAVGAEDPRLRDGREAFADPDVEMVQRGRVQADENFARPRAPDRARLRGRGPPVRRPHGSAPRAPGQTIGVNAAELQALGAELGLDAVGAARAEPYDGDRAPHPRAPRARPLRRHALHDGAPGGVVPSRDASAGRAHGRLRSALLLAAGAGASRGSRAPAALHVVRRVRSPPREARRARHARSAAGTAFSSTRTSTSTARPPRAAGSASTARTRCSSRGDTARGSCSER